MKKEELLSIGLTEEQADKVFAMNGKDIEKYKKAAEDARAPIPLFPVCRECGTSLVQAEKQKRHGVSAPGNAAKTGGTLTRSR